MSTKTTRVALQFLFIPLKTSRVDSKTIGVFLIQRWISVGVEVSSIVILVRVHGNPVLASLIVFIRVANDSCWCAPSYRNAISRIDSTSFRLRDSSQPLQKLNTIHFFRYTLAPPPPDGKLHCTSPQPRPRSAGDSRKEALTFL